jgi:(p)ppGpp synthase/HD superfamily hydrolase
MSIFTGKIGIKSFYMPMMSGGNSGGGPSGVGKMIMPFDQIANMSRSALGEVKSKILQYKPSADLTLLDRSLECSLQYHRGKRFEGGGPIVMHGIDLANFLVEWQMDIEIIAAALLHNVPPNTIRLEVNERTANIVRSKSKLDQFTYKPDKENLQRARCFNAMIRSEPNLNILLFSAADIAQTILSGSTKEEWKANQEYVERALNVTAPFLKFLGYFDTGEVLEDTAFYLLDPNKYKKYKVLSKVKSLDIKKIMGLETRLTSALSMVGIPARYSFSPKKPVSIWRKLKSHGVRTKDLDRIEELDVIKDYSRIRLITDTKENCYQIEKIVRAIMGEINWAEDTSFYRDYIKKPKKNKYKSIHLKFINTEAKYFEVQIRTEEMHYEAMYGEPSHFGFRYSDIPTINTKDRSAKARFIAHRTHIINEGWYYILDEKGLMHEIITSSHKLKPTVLDLAFARSEEEGIHLAGAYIMTPDGWRDIGINDTIRNGDTVKIITSPEAFPTEERRTFSHSSLASVLSDAWLKSPEKTKRAREKTARDYISLGKETMEKQLGTFNISVKTSFSSILNARGVKTPPVIDVLYSFEDYAIGDGLRSERDLMLKIGISENPEKMCGVIIGDYVNWFTAVAYDPNNFNRPEMPVFLLHEDKTGIFPWLADSLRKSKINLSSLHIAPAAGLSLQRWVITDPEASKLKKLMQLVAHSHAGAQPAFKSFDEMPITVQIFIKEDKLATFGIAAKIADSISNAGAHVYAGNIGPFSLSSLKVRIPKGARKDILPRLEAQLGKIDEIENFNLF